MSTITLDLEILERSGSVDLISRSPDVEIDMRDLEMEVFNNDDDLSN